MLRMTLIVDAKTREELLHLYGVACDKENIEVVGMSINKAQNRP